MSITASILILLVVAALAVLWLVVRNRQRPVQSVNELMDRTKPVDVSAFRTLMDAADIEFLRIHLAPADFRRWRRQQVRVALLYVGRISANAAVLAMLGESARRSQELGTAQLGAELVGNALRVRMLALSMRGQLYALLVFPGWEPRPWSMVEAYESVRMSVASMCHRQNPAAAPRILAAL